ncbi:MAG: thermonuclease family protein [Patescibacteria group bacterium]
MKKLLIITTITLGTFIIFFSFNKILINTRILEKKENRIYGIKNSNSAPEASSSSTISQAGIKVIRVVDGDTIEIEGGQRVRYIGIDTPETVHPQKVVQCFGKEASEKNKELVEGKSVTLTKDVSETDKYGRLLRYVYIGDIMVNDFLVRQGYAYSSSYPPDVAHQEEFKEAELEARQGDRGLWSACQPGSKILTSLLIPSRQGQMTAA